MNALNPQPILASSSDELYNPFSEEARISPYNPHILFKPDPCPINGVHFTPIPDPLYKFSVDLLEQWKAWLQVPSGRTDDKELYNRLNRILSRNVGLTFDRDVLVEYIQYL